MSSFPRRAEQLPWVTREVEIMRLLGPALGSLVPRFELVGRPGELFPLPFVGYRRLPAVSAGRVPVAQHPQLAAHVGDLLAALHRIDPTGVPPTPAGWEDEAREEMGGDLVRAAPLIRPRLPSDLLARAEPYLRGSVPPPGPEGPRRLIHNDIGPDHLLADPASGRLTGVIDFTDAMAGDPLLDLAGLIGIGGFGFIGEVLSAYDLELGRELWPQLIWLARVLALTWLGEAAAHDPERVPRRVRWVARALEEPARGS